MKKITRHFLAALACISCGSIQAQWSNMSGNVVTQPCNNNGMVTVTVTNLTPPISFTYSNWMTNQVIVHSGVPTVTDALTNITGYSNNWGNPNSWFVTAFDGTTTANWGFILNPAFNIDSLTAIPANCPAQGTVHATSSGGTPPYTYTWTNQTTMLSYVGNPVPLPDGFYNLTVEDGAGCMVSTPTGSGNISVYSITGINVNLAVTGANCTNGSATVTASGGTPPYTYLWHNNATGTSISGLSQGNISCVVTDALGCQSMAYGFIPQLTTLNFNTTITNATCQQNDGAVLSFISGGTAPYTFQWSNMATTQNLSNIPGGTYQVVVTDANNCTGTYWAVVGKSTPITVTYNSTASSCTAATGGATLLASGGQAPYNITWLTSPPASGTSINNVPPGNYGFQVTDANNCVQSGMVVVSQTGYLTASVLGSTVTCPSNTGNISVSVSGSNPPFSYLWNTSSTASSLNNVPLGAYSCTITDNNGCSLVKYGNIAQQSPVTIGFASSPVSCVFASDGTVTAQATGGTAPYVYLWSNSQSGNTLNNVSTGWYYCTVTDANGCSHGGGTYVSNSGTNTSCYCTITGTVYRDLNSNCSQDFGETGIPNIQVHCSGMGYAYTNANGIYSFQVPSGTYTISESIQQLFPLSSCETNNKVVNVSAAANCVNTVNFANNVIQISDVRINTWNWNLPVPGNVYTQKVVVENDGTINEANIKFGYVHDGQLNFSSCTPWTLTQQNSSSYPNWYSIMSGFPTLNYSGTTSATFNYNVPTNIPINTIIHFKDTVAKASPIATQWLTDYTPWNNVNQYNAIVVSSYDPNFKEVSPAGEGPQGNISPADSILTYMVHFQNEGTYFAQNVVVVDTIDSDFRINTLKPGYGSHSYTTRINENGVATFTFKDIMLPWKSMYGDNLSSGMFTYSIKTKKGLPVGTKFTNKAAIYFDYNEPIITNTTMNTIAEKKVGIAEATPYQKDRLMLFPNPASTGFAAFVLSHVNERADIRLYDASGKLVSSQQHNLETGENVLLQDTELLRAGIYLVRLESASQQLSHKLVITR